MKLAKISVSSSSFLSYTQYEDLIDEGPLIYQMCPGGGCSQDDVQA